MIVGPSLAMLREYAWKVGASPMSSSIMLGGGGVAFVGLGIAGETGGLVVVGGSTLVVGGVCSWAIARLKIVARLLMAFICLWPMLEKGALGA